MQLKSGRTGTFHLNRRRFLKNLTEAGLSTAAAAERLSAGQRLDSRLIWPGMTSNGAIWRFFSVFSSPHEHPRPEGSMRLTVPGRIGSDAPVNFRLNSPPCPRNRFFPTWSRA